MLAASFPSFAQVTVADDDNTSAQFVDASQLQAAVQLNTGDANAAANDESVAVATIDQGITQNQANVGFGEISDLN